MHRAVRLHPQPRKELSAEQTYEDLKFPTSQGSDSKLPYVAINAVSTLDGKVSMGEKSSGIGSGVDRRIMRVLRSQSDAVLVGAGTVRAEKLSLTVPEDLASWRETRGESSQPLGVVLSRTGDIPSKTLAQISPNLLVLTEADLPDSNRKPEERTIREYLLLLCSKHNVRRLLVEGGPTINHALLQEKLVDELFLTLSPKIYGGEEKTLLDGASLPDPKPDLNLISAFLCEHELFLRYSIPRQQKPESPISFR